MKNKLIIFTFLLLISKLNFGNKKSIDSLLSIINSEAPDSIKSSAYFNLSNITYLNNPRTALIYINKSIALFQSSYNTVPVNRYLSKAVVQRILGHIDSSLYYCNIVLNIAIKEKRYTILNNCYREFGLISVAQNNNSKAIEYFNKQLSIIKKHHINENVSGIYNNIGIAYGNKGDWDMASEYFRRSLKDDLKNNRVLALGNDYNNLGIVHIINNRIDSAEKYLLLGLKYRLETNDNLGVGGSLNNLALIAKNKKNFIKALTLADSALSIAVKNDFKKLQVEVYDSYDQIYSEMKDYKKAYEFLMKKNQLNRAFEKEETNNKIQELESNIELEQKQSQILEKDLALVKSEHKQQKQLSIIIIGSVLLIALMAFLYNFFRSNTLLKERNSIISKQKNLIEEKHTNITDSINYAQKIQQALIITEENLTKNLKEGFVIFKPRDVVSGDFYWFSRQNGYNIVALADCTGHGVPGAFMSMIGITLLNKIVIEKGITSPAQILNELRTDVIKALHLNSNGNDSRDGMDMAIVAFNDKELLYAGANSQVIVIDGGNIIELKPNKQPIGLHINNENYTEHRLNIDKEMKAYLFSDGIIDQFGGPEGKKVKSKQFKNWLLKTSNLNLKDQRKEVELSLNDWKKGFEQTDDISLIGIKLG